MRKLLSFLILLAMLVSVVSPALAQDVPDSSGATAPPRLFMPLVSSDNTAAQLAEPEQPAPPTPAQPPAPEVPFEGQRHGRVTAAERQEAAARAASLGMPTAEDMVASAGAAAMAPGTVPHFYGPFANYANSPLPSLQTVQGIPVTVGNPLIERPTATDSASNVLVVNLQQPLPTGMVTSFQTYAQPNTGPATFNAYVLRPIGGNDYTVIHDIGPLQVPAVATGQVLDFPVNNLAVLAGDVIAHYGRGIPITIGSGTDALYYPASPAPAFNTTITLGVAPYPAFNQARTYSFAAQVLDFSGGASSLTGGMRKFVDGLPGLGAGAANSRGQYIPVAVPDTTTYPGSDYYEIGLVQYREQMHADLPPTLLRGYVQLSTGVVPGEQAPLSNVMLDGTSVAISGYTGVTPPHYLGPTIVANKDRPVRILFRNLLPTGVGGDLFIPVDTTVMGAGPGPNISGAMEADPQNPECGVWPKLVNATTGNTDCFTENRATLHLHGGLNPWISDGTPHQWITPAGDNAAYPKGVSVKNVPDMPDPGPGAMTFFYTNQQSARLMFYHDHAWGITRLNVYAGEAAGYLITDAAEQALVNNGTLPADQIPLIIQDKTFVPDQAQLELQDPTWDMARWGGKGNLWVPHVYMPAQNPGDASGVNAFGRWAYGPWFWPPTTAINYGPIANPYYDANCNPDAQWCEPPLNPGVPNISMGMEAFNDTPVVNGVAYPTLTLDPKPYRLRILSAANDRFFNLSFYTAVDANGVPCDASNPNPAPEATGVACTEVALNPAEVAAALDDPAGVFPTPLGNEGPSWVQIGTEGGFLPAPVVIPPQPITWVTDPTVFNAGNVDKHSLLLGPAERADVVVDFSQYAGQTLILYNDAPAAFPARDPRYDYYTGNPDLTSSGGAPSTLPGYGPNTRTVMQIKIAPAAPASAFNLANLEAAFAHKPDGSGVFESSQHPIIVGQAAYNSAYGTSFTANGALAGLVQIFDTSFSFTTLLGNTLTFPLQPKQIQDEMGEAFDPDYGRMSGFLGLEKPGANAGVQNMILYPYINPATEIVDGIELPPGAELTPIASANDGTQIWKITHNGVDTHPVHFHLFDVQVINRVGWDGIIRRPDANELGWKDTVRISPLEDTIVAMRPVLPKAPFGLPDSNRPLNPMMPLGFTGGFNNVDANGDPLPTPIVNQVVSFGWEYVWHCHILSHEEMDMMRPLSAIAARALPATPGLLVTGNAGSPIALQWTDGTLVSTDWMSWGDASAEVGYRIERATGNGAFGVIGTALANATTFTDNTTAAGVAYQYRVVAFNAAGDSPSNVAVVGVIAQPPVAPSNLTAALSFGPVVNLAWADNSDNETAFVVERAVNGGAFAAVATLGAGTTSYADPVQPGANYLYQVYAINDTLRSGYSNAASVTTPPAPVAPTNLAATLLGSLTVGPSVRLTFRDNATNETGFIIQRSVNGGDFATIASLGPRANRGNVTYTDAVMANTSYAYRVFTLNGVSPSTPSNTVNVTVPAAPNAPATFTGTTRVTNATARIDLAWTDSSNNESRFVVQRALDANFTNGLVSFNRGANTTTFSQTGLPRGVAYYYRIMAQNQYGQSAWVTLTPFPIVTP